ncbi:MAG: alginate lyase family protein [Provencibacterium sp.]|jgi:hypothetical protein|nr:alginate lyase family protein [Provencibacterium sp.]
MLTCHTIDWPAIRKKVKENDWARACLRQIREDFACVIGECPSLPPLEQSEWAHYYFCPDCAVRLSFSFSEPHHHVCPLCHKDLSGGDYDGAWRKAVHGSIVSNLERAAVLANLSPENGPYTEYVRRMILFYADHYRDYAVHGRHAGYGRVMPQSLTEAIFIIELEQVLRMVSELKLFSGEEWAHIQKDLFLPAAELIRPQIDKIHNIHAWMVSAVCACASVLEDGQMLKKAIYGPMGWLEQLEQGVNEDGIWYEVSAGYHFYSMHALLSGARIAKENGIPVYQNPRLLKMGTGIFKLAYPDGLLPAYNDSGTEISLSSHAHLFEELYALQEDPEYENLLSFCYNYGGEHGCTPINALPDYVQTPSSGFARNSISALLYGKPALSGAAEVPSESVLLEHAGIAVLRQGELRAALKFSPDCGWHDHCDKLSLELIRGTERLCSDTGTAGYAARLTNEWCRTPLAHNMVVIDQKRQEPCRAKCLTYAPEQIEAEACEAYPGVRLTRRVRLLPSGMEDTFTIGSEGSHIIDYAFRCAGQLQCFLEMQPAEPFAEENGYDQLMNIRKAETDNTFSVCWETGKSRVVLKMEACPGTEVFLADCFGVNRSQPQSILVVRRRANQTVFRALYRIENCEH